MREYFSHVGFVSKFVISVYGSFVLQKQRENPEYVESLVALDDHDTTSPAEIGITPLGFDVYVRSLITSSSAAATEYVPTAYSEPAKIAVAVPDYFRQQ